MRAAHMKDDLAEFNLETEAGANEAGATEAGATEAGATGTEAATENESPLKKD